MSKSHKESEIMKAYGISPDQIVDMDKGAYDPEAPKPHDHTAHDPISESAQLRLDTESLLRALADEGIAVEEDRVNSPSHYTMGPAEAIDIIEHAVGDPEPYLHGNTLKYLLRANHKGARLEDLKKAQWYLGRLIRWVEANEEFWGE